ncbi:hypothetical protein KC318_g5061 [Hortaea werneckii]|uniref:SprT-like domain-containing protein n=1 Tax=Hortaea werneckii TaxID=91943 RepID=A0A3M6YCI2_HORWE|nr:hypothetical protein KC334_g4514 [Hortaea werneckii]KAI7015510.1 hypothetical protein KC355_g4308 [Hortaea werneckii]KAI7668800.1 hypothetical protein KC318_g5061 [Hortaea werneckii]RMY00501.1 hypothetical protein D0867_11725 [Hortaea werneckii]RMY21698.1 hypothetical protein D0866_12178 [Hortaea werneckii]
MASLHIQDDQKLRSRRTGPSKLPNIPRLKPSLSKPVPVKPSPAPQLDESEAESPKDSESEFEESVWCGSDGDSYNSDDELPSPSKFISFPPKPLPQRPAQNPGLDLSNTFKALSIAEPARESRTQVEEERRPSTSSRPTSSSDKENDNQAILHFSPPRLYSPKKQATPERPTTPPPNSPSKGRLLSPSKRQARLPTPPLRQSIDAFWNAETVNEWNDQYSPQKEWKSPKKLDPFSKQQKSSSPPASPRKAASPTKRSKAEIEAKKGWEARKHQVAENFLKEVDEKVTGGKVQDLAQDTGGVRFIWSKTLNSTAGRANWKRETIRTKQLDGTTSISHRHHASIELAEKVIDDEERLLNVIAHEFCHLCNFMISGIKDQPHGKQFKEWGRKCTAAFAHRGVEVTTKHSYQIEYKYIWQCSNEECGAKFQRHSKSIDPKRHRCGSCRSSLAQIKPVPRQGGAGGGGATGYAAYVKQHFAAVKAGMPGASQKQVMAALGEKYRSEKVAANASTGGGDKLASEDGGGKGESQMAQPEEAVDGIARRLDFVNLGSD